MKTKFWIVLIVLPFLLSGAAFAGPPDDGGPTSRMVVTWQDNSDNESEFIIERAESGSPPTEFAELAHVPANATRHAKYVDDTVKPGRKYWYRVKACNAYGDSAWSNTASAVARLVEAQPSRAPDRPLPGE